MYRISSIHILHFRVVPLTLCLFIYEIFFLYFIYLFLFYYFIYLVPLKYQPANYTFRVIEGSSPHLLLKVKFASNNTQYNWTRNGLPITSDSHLSLHIDGLIFSGMSRGDSGVYVVQASDSNGYDEAIINVEVYCK